MKNQRLLNVFGQIDEKYIEEATPAFQKQPGKLIWMKWGAVTACAAIAVFTCVRFATLHTAEPAPDSTIEAPVIADNLPSLASRFEGDGMGFEGVMTYNIQKENTANPWTEETKLTTLPVYRNLAYTDGAGVPVYLSDEEMLALAENTAAALGVTVENTEYSRPDMIQTSSDTKESAEDSVTAEKAYQLTAATALGDIRVSGNGGISIFLSPSVALPEDYSFTHSDTSDKDALEVLQYLTERYSDLYDLNQPVIYSGGYYSFSGEQNRYYRAYEGDGTLEEQILHYNFDTVSFFPDDASNLWIIRFGNILDSAEKLGDYPLITADTAQKLLLADEFITSVPLEYLADGEIKKKDIKKIELIYRSDNLNEVFMPYYRFYVELKEFDSSMADGLNNYGAFYVPAISGEYLSDFPVWDGRFN